MESENLVKQIEEIEALTAIYDEDFTLEGGSSSAFSIKVKVNLKEAEIYVNMPPDYPKQSPPKYEISAPWMDRGFKEELYKALDEIYINNKGEAVVYQFVEKVREFLYSVKPQRKEKEIKRKDIELEESISQLDISCPEIYSGEVIVDRKSTFQGHAAVVHNCEDVHAVLSKLKQNKKILNATHNMYAYRIERKKESGTSMLQDCDDDGENHAGGRMLHLLQILDVKNVLVVVSRWYGGIQLGPDRFRHINNAARQVLQHAGLLPKK